MNPLGLFKKDENEEVKMHYEDNDAIQKISAGLLNMLPLGYHRHIVLVCIGTDRSTGDSLGPLAGTFLQDSSLKRFHLYGTLEDPVHAVNLKEKLELIHQSHFRPFIIALDACLGRLNHVGEIRIAMGPVKPGAGVNKDLPEVGDLNITGIVNVSGYMEFSVLQNTRLNLVMKMAKTIAAGIVETDLAYAARKPRLKLEPERKETVN